MKWWTKIKKNFILEVVFDVKWGTTSRINERWFFFGVALFLHVRNGYVKYQFSTFRQTRSFWQDDHWMIFHISALIDLSHAKFEYTTYLINDAEFFYYLIKHS